MGACFSRSAHTTEVQQTVSYTTVAYTMTRVRSTGLLDLPSPVLLEIVGTIWRSGEPLYPLLFVNHELGELAQRILLYRVALANRRGAASLIRLLERDTSLSEAMISLRWTGLQVDDAGADGRSPRPDPSQVARIIELSVNLRILLLIAKSGTEAAAIAALRGAVGDAPKLQGLRLFGGSVAEGQEGVLGEPLAALLCTPVAGRLRSLTMRGEVADSASVAERLPELTELVELEDQGSSMAVVHGVVTRSPNLLSLNLYGPWNHSLGQLSDGQLQQLHYLYLHDPSGQILADYGPANLAATLGRLVQLRHLHLSGVLLDHPLMTALPPSLTGLELVGSTEDAIARITPMAPLLADQVAGTALPALNLVVTMAMMGSAVLDDACTRRGIELTYYQPSEARRAVRARL